MTLISLISLIFFVCQRCAQAPIHMPLYFPGNHVSVIRGVGLIRDIRVLVLGIWGVRGVRVIRDIRVIKY
jgi:hypothetical protein